MGFGESPTGAKSVIIHFLSDRSGAIMGITVPLFSPVEEVACDFRCE